MRPCPYPRQVLSVILAGVIDEHQGRMIEYLQAENKTLRE
jgi:hypothetical protein